MNQLKGKWIEETMYNAEQKKNNDENSWTEYKNLQNKRTNKVRIAKTTYYKRVLKII